jgi:hypothetical protein
MRTPQIRVSVRTLMSFVLVIGVGLGWVVLRANAQRDAVAAIERAGGRVMYDWDEITPTRTKPTGRPPWPNWIVACLGPDYFGHVVRVSLGDTVTDETMAHVGRLDRLDELIISRGSKLTGAGMIHLRSLPNLKRLGLIRAAGPGVSEALLKNLPAA